MKLHPKHFIILGAFFLFLAVALGAFGAHGLQKALDPKNLATFKTGVSYHFYHGFGLLLVGIIQKQFDDLNLEKVALCFTMGILFFSFNCYFYAISNIKTFAMIVPLGGVLFILGWLMLSFKVYRSLK